MARRHGRPKASRFTTLPPLPSLMPDAPPGIRFANHTAMKSEWLDPDDLRPNARTGRTIFGHMAFCPLRWCLRRHKEASSFTAEHIEAADRLRLAFDGSRLGFSALRDWRPVTAINYRPMTGPTQIAMRQLKCRREFDAVWGLFSESDRALLLAVVLRNIGVGRTADLLGKTKPWTTQALVAALHRLCEHYDIDRAVSYEAITPLVPGSSPTDA